MFGAGTRSVATAVSITAAIAVMSARVNAQGRPSWIFENSDHRHFSSTNGILQLTGGPGWLRLPGVFGDFTLKFEFRALDEKTDAAVAVRTWTGRSGWPNQGYRIRLTDPDPKDGASMLIGRRQTVRELTALTPAWQSVGTWQTCEIAAEGARITLGLNGRPAGTYEIEERAGQVLFEVKRGVVEFRNITFEPTPESDVQPANAFNIDWLKKNGGEPPRLVTEVRPQYTREAMERRIEGNVALEAVVLPDGSPAGIRVTRSLDPDLDASAIGALKRWRFKPATLGGQPVPVIVDIQIRFTRW